MSIAELPCSVWLHHFFTVGQSLDAAFGIATMRIGAPNCNGSLEERPPVAHQSGALRSRNAFAITDTELRLMAALAIIGDSSTPKNGYSTPAATGMPSAL